MCSSKKGAREMNANELADYLENREFRIPNHNEIKAATMLRQLQAENEALKKAYEEERKYARYLSNLCTENDIQIIWYF